ncbi:MAG: hypothetical protein ACOVQS_08415 [Chitinophagaceae bacterium]|jgi:hypothetical protein
MQTGSHHEVNIDLILDSLDGMERAQPRPFLHTRVMARMEQNRRNPWVQTWNFVSRPAVSLTIIAGLMLLNFITLYQRTNDRSAIHEESIASVGVEYEAQFVSYYAINDEQP